MRVPHRDTQQYGACVWGGVDAVGRFLALPTSPGLYHPRGDLGEGVRREEEGAIGLGGLS